MKLIPIGFLLILCFASCNKKIDHHVRGRVVDIYDTTGVPGVPVYSQYGTSFTTDNQGFYEGIIEVDKRNYNQTFLALHPYEQNYQGFPNESWKVTMNGQDYELIISASPNEDKAFDDFQLFKVWYTNCSVQPDNYQAYKLSYKNKSLKGNFNQVIKKTIYYYNNIHQFITLTEGWNVIEVYVEQVSDPSVNYTFNDSIFVDENNPPPAGGLTYSF